MQAKELNYSQVCFSFDENVVSKLRNTCKASGIVGQSRAMQALSTGMNINTKGYNIYISGDNGTGRHSAVRQIASQIKTKPVDLVYTYNAKNPQRPILLVLPSPQGTSLYESMEEIASLARRSEFKTAIDNLCKIESDNQYLSAFLMQCRLALSKENGNADIYRVNVVKTGTSDCAPLVEEYHPTLSNLFGTFHKQDKMSHLCITLGSALEACGGFIVLRAEQVVSQPDLWDSLKLFAESSSYLIHSSDSHDNWTLRPYAQDLGVKVILIGSDSLYDKLCETDEQFLRLFKISAEFDFSMPANESNIAMTISYLTDIASRNNMNDITDGALCSLLRYSCRLSERRDELTARLCDVGDLLFESNFIADKVIDDAAVEKAIEKRDFSSGLTESRIGHEIETGEMIISLEGSKTGVVNGLAVMDHGLASFGTPAVISVSVAPGSEGIVNIEHEAGLSGEIHDKGLLILEGYLRRQYARSFPLSLYAGICFEQSYGEVDGDSASSSELFALLSAIGELPVRQDIAVTGSVNQMGDIQAVGGINEKITGFYDICSKMGLTGHQGVIIPYQNESSLILPMRVIEAVKNNKFHIYTISSVNEGMEILTQRQSGSRNVKGQFPPDSVNRIIESKLRRLYELSSAKS